MSGLGGGGNGAVEACEGREVDCGRSSEMEAGDGDAQACGAGAEKFRVNSETVFGTPLGQEL